MYVAMLLTDWYVTRRARSPFLPSYFPRHVLKSSDGAPGKEHDFYIGRSETAMWMRVVSSWVCMVIYIWSLVAPVLMPDRSVPSSCPTGGKTERETLCRFGD